MDKLLIHKAGQHYLIFNVETFKELVVAHKIYPYSCLLGEHDGVPRLPVILDKYQIRYLLKNRRDLVKIQETFSENEQGLVVEKVNDLEIHDVSDRVFELKYLFFELLTPNYYVVDGLKFGCDFLLYKEIPYRSHSTHCVTVLGREKRISMDDLVSRMRCSRSGGKVAVLASIEDGKINAFCLKWVNIIP
ncbi:putative tRNA-splicing endonuclease subunit tsp-4 [Thelohanellus kitauei]|uniref:tRNA-intron lyase n=1 Tax=Thelohanellus kitauei TaxID=669202 RepID=A0A0C2IKM8_THEKT|nr:putative tRNA-splicing endonuclease subunit tsp-4 [Thelohanellus kitauei]